MLRTDRSTRGLTVAGLVAAAVLLASLDTPIRGPVTALVLVVAPGFAAALAFRETPLQARLAIAVAATLVVNVVVAQTMLIAGAWSPRGGVVAVALVSGGLLGYGLTRASGTLRAGQAIVPAGTTAAARSTAPADGLAQGAERPEAAATGRRAPIPGPPPDATTVEVVRPAELGDTEVEHWRAMQCGSPHLGNPFLAPEFAQAVGRSRDNARVAVISQGAEVVGFFPFDRHRFGIGRPIASGLTDCQGVVHAPGLELDAKQLLDACGLSVFEFDHLVEGQPFFEPHTTARAASPLMDLTDGYDAYEAYLRSNSAKFLRTTRSKERKLGREVGEVRFEDGVRGRGALRRLMSWKSDQYRRTGRADRFAQPWIVELVDDLLATDSPTFAGSLSMLYAGDRPIAGHFGLRSETILVGWFPAYDVGFAKYSPGLIQHLCMAKAAAAGGIRHVDLGKGAREYKDSLKNREVTVAEGRVLRLSPVASAYWAARASTRTARNVVVGHPRLFRVADRALKRYGRVTSALTSRPGPPAGPAVAGGDRGDERTAEVDGTDRGPTDGGQATDGGKAESSGNVEVAR